MAGNSKTIRFTTSKTADVVAHRIRFGPSGSTMNYDLPYTSIINKTISIPLDDKITTVDGYYSVWLTAVDHVGNESNQLYCGKFRRDTMAKLNTKTLHFLPSNSPDTVEHRIRIAVDAAPFSYDLPAVSIAFDAAAYGALPTAPAATKINVNIGSLANAPKASGTYEVFVTAVDAAGNESDPLVIRGAVFDFVAPTAPTAGSID